MHPIRANPLASSDEFVVQEPVPELGIISMQIDEVVEQMCVIPLRGVVKNFV